MAALLFAAVAQAAPQRLTEAAVRAFVARQEAAWNARDLKAFEAALTPDARFVDQARGSDNRIVPYGASSRAEATAQARRVFATSRIHAMSTVDRVEIAADGRQARVLAHEVSRIETPGKPPRTLCAETEQVVVLTAGRLLSRGQTDTAVRCRTEMNRIQPR
jgi:hypothetical protein